MPSTEPVTEPAWVVVIDARPTGTDDEHGRPMFLIDLTVLVDDGDPWRSRITIALDHDDARRVHPGAELVADVRRADATVAAVHLAELVPNRRTAQTPQSSTTRSQS